MGGSAIWSASRYLLGHLADPGTLVPHYRSGVLTRVRSFVLSVWRMPAAPGATPAGRADHAFVAAVAVVAVLETVARPEMHLRWVALAAFLVWLPTLLVRRTLPVLPVLAFLAVTLVLTTVAAVTDSPMPSDLDTAVVALLVPYSLARWAKGEVALLGSALFYGIAGTALVVQELVPSDRVGGGAVVVAATAVGAAARARSLLRTRQLDDVRRDERDRLARDLHDTVAHHLTAIAISAQAGLAVADEDPSAARDALRRIDEEATRTLAETRSVVRVLRTDDEAPHRPLTDLAALADPALPGPDVEVDLADGVDALSPTVAAAVHRIAQEAVANARRHAQDATLVRVAVTPRGDDVELTVTDDGRPTGQHARGFGIVGMSERATLLGGTLEAGPRAPRGWRVTAVLPTQDVR